MAIEFDIQESKILKGVYIITPNKFRDLRGEIWTAFTNEAIDKLLPDKLQFMHDKFIHFKHNVIRSIHGDAKTHRLFQNPLFRLETQNKFRKRYKNDV